MLAQLYLTRVGGEEEHDGEARQQSSVLDGKGEEEAAAARVLFLTTHLIHLWKLRSTNQRGKGLFKRLYNCVNMVSYTSPSLLNSIPSLFTFVSK